MSNAPVPGRASRDDEDRDSATSSGATPVARPVSKLVFDDPLDQQSPDDSDRGWGEQSSSGGSASDLARFLDEKPPHHI
ncbi:hypothetical protein [Streptomyces sp. NBC_01089]|uniref:hypothetical protein n=1 Tax=Streptomyces sp. NBC_01089 TaxID=2903747 RepID=UPI00386E2C7E|nr:hypothetical protein OG510_22640 [Streptomyces sp. NBC_01089]